MRRLRFGTAMTWMLAAGCSGSAAMTTPSPAATTTTASGFVTSLQTAAPLGGVSVSATAASQPTVTTSTTDVGAFLLNIPTSTNNWTLAFDAGGYLPRRMPLAQHAGDASTNLISLDPPFSIDFYRQLVRGARDNKGVLQPRARWTMAPKFFFITKTIDLGETVPDAVIDLMQEMASRNVPLLTGGRFTVAGFGRGEANTAPRNAYGWILVGGFSTSIPDQPEPNAGGWSFIGSNPGEIRLRMRPTELAPVRSCGYYVAGAFYHELVHAMGYWHTDEGFSVGNLCEQLLPDVLYHAKIAYSRPVGNVDPDTDAGATPAASPAAVR